MADAILGVVVEKSISLIQNEFANISGLREKTEKLSNTLTLIREVLEDAEERQMTERPVKIWLQQLRDAAHVLDDILDDCSIESLLNGDLPSFNPKNIMFRYQVGHKLNEMMERLDQIAEAKEKFGLREGFRKRPNEVAEWRHTSSIIASSQLYGRDEDKKKVVDFLLCPARCSDFLSVYPIVGPGGLGKTTLAQLVYNDQSISDHFDLKIWIPVHENFTMKSILRSIIESVMRFKYDIFALDIMEQKVQELLQSKRYLLVLDDVQKQNQSFEVGLSQDKWNKLRSLLSCGSKGASILVCTRDKDVAKIMEPCHAHTLSGLSEDQCWSLFKQRAFGPEREEREQLVEIGKEIVKKCKGSSLAAKALGGLMCSRNEEKEWLEVKDCGFWDLPEDENGILSALRLIYLHLMPTQKQCFAFCAMFPKHREINKQDLIHLWMANGFLSTQENLDMEEVGNMVWNELHQMSFFQDVRTYGEFHRNICFKMHDVVHDFARSIAEQECMSFEKINLGDLPRNTHHVSFSFITKKPIEKKDCENNVESLRTLYQLEFSKIEISSCFPTSIRALRTNSLESTTLGNLTHLRYLELADLSIKNLPDSIYNLRKLEILKLKNLSNLICLPKHLTRLQNLRHLVFDGCSSLSHMCPNVHKLSHLRTLSEYIVEAEAGHSLTELCDLNLGGELSIKCLQNVCNLSEAQEANLKGKEGLQKLSLLWHMSGETKSDFEKLLEVLQPHPNLKGLTISNYKGLHWPKWMGNNSDLNNLVSLKLSNCEICLELPTLGKLRSLKSLEIYSRFLINHVKYLDDDDDECYDGVEMRAFPSLESLSISKFPNLERLLKMERGNMFPCLSYLYVHGCPKLQLPFLPCLKTLHVSGSCNELLLKSISCLRTLHYLSLDDNQVLTSFPEGMMNNLTTLKTLQISGFNKLKELPCEITKLIALESLKIRNCSEVESFPEQGMEGLCSLRSLEISGCRGLRSLPEGVQHLTSIEALHISYSPILQNRCKKGTGEDWHKIAHIPKVTLRDLVL